jgi:hypothetical protein
MKKYSWIIALLIALSLAFFACDFGTEEDDDGDDEEDYDVLVLFSDGKFFERHEDEDGNVELGSTGPVLLNAAELTGGATLFEAKKAIMLAKSGTKFSGGIDLRVDEDIKGAKFLVIKWGYDSSDYLSDYPLFGDYEFVLANDNGDDDTYDATAKDIDESTFVIALGGGDFDDLDDALISIDFEIDNLEQTGESMSVKRVYFFDVRLVSGLPPEKKPGLKPKE